MTTTPNVSVTLWKHILNWFETISLVIQRCVDHSFSAQMNKCFVVKDGVDVQVLGTNNNVVSISANNAIHFAIHFQLPLSLKSDKICTSLCTCSVLMSSLCLTHYLKNTNENSQKVPFLMHSAHNFIPKRNELRYHWCFITTVFHRALASCCSRKIE